MTIIQWKCGLVERPFCEQLQGMGWVWIEGDPDLPESMERIRSRKRLWTMQGRDCGSRTKPTPYGAAREYFDLGRSLQHNLNQRHVAMGDVFIPVQ